MGQSANGIAIAEIHSLAIAMARVWRHLRRAPCQFLQHMMLRPHLPAPHTLHGGLTQTQCWCSPRISDARFEKGGAHRPFPTPIPTKKYKHRKPGPHPDLRNVVPIAPSPLPDKRQTSKTGATPRNTSNQTGERGPQALSWSQRRLFRKRCPALQQHRDRISKLIGLDARKPDGPRVAQPPDRRQAQHDRSAAPGRVGSRGRSRVGGCAGRRRNPRDVVECRNVVGWRGTPSDVEGLCGMSWDVVGRRSAPHHIPRRHGMPWDVKGRVGRTWDAVGLWGIIGHRGTSREHGASWDVGHRGMPG